MQAAMIVQAEDCINTDAERKTIDELYMRRLSRVATDASPYRYCRGLHLYRLLEWSLRRELNVA